MKKREITDTKDQEKGNKKTKTDLRGVEVLASLLVAYPQVSRATYDPSNRTLSLIFLCRGPLSAVKRKKIALVYRDSVDVYLSLSDKTASTIGCSWEQLDTFYSFQVERDVASLSPGEINLTVDLISMRADIVSTVEDNVNGDSLDDATSAARWLLEDTLNEVRHLDGKRRLVAFREGERVLVFDK
jgi:hypothetical protein